MIFGAATNEDRRQRSDNPKLRSPADLIYISFADIKLILQNPVFLLRSFIIKNASAFSFIANC